MKRIDIAGKVPQIICEIESGISGAAWSPDGTIVFLDTIKTVLQKVPASGGTPVPVTRANAGDRFHLMPQFLPDGRTFLYFRRTQFPQTSGIYVGSLDKNPGEQDQKPILLTERQAYYSPVGGDHLITLRDQTLFAQPFDLKNLKLTGQPIAIADSVTSFSPASTGRFSVSRNGVLAYNTGATTVGRVLITDRYSGKTLRPLNPEQTVVGAEISPDSKLVAMPVVDSLAGSTNLWGTDLSTGGRRQVTSSRGRTISPVWSPDGRYIA